MRTRLSLLLLLVLVGTGCATKVKNTSRSFRTVVIDAGHGGKDSGARQRRGRGLEKNATLDLALRLEPKLRAAKFKTVMTRNGDYFVELNDRAKISNAQRNAIFVSLHFNDSPRRVVRGVEIYYKSPYALPIAQRIASKLSTLAPVRGILTANYRVLKLNRYPAVLIEGGYLSNRREASNCLSASYREAMAERIAQALIEQRFGSQKAATTAAPAE